jgi:HAD superfamily hydrolase (TIGR01484 family)
MNSVGKPPKILICSDLDRTLIPNGSQEESDHARPVFRHLAECANIHVAYVSGRDKQLIQDAINEFYLPLPDYAIGDVGTTLYRVVDGDWRLSDDWSDEIAQDWKGLRWEKLSEFFEDMPELRLQEPEKQSRFKLSFYTNRDIDYQTLAKNIQTALAKTEILANIIWSVDEISTNGLLDIIPARANKLHAIRFLMQEEEFAENCTVFAGDSGNDLDALTSGLQAILVNNAMDEVRNQAVEILSRKQMTNRLYLPQGNFYGMNGNYAAGVLEGLVHFIPETGELIARAIEKEEPM